MKQPIDQNDNWNSMPIAIQLGWIDHALEEFRMRGIHTTKGHIVDHAKQLAFDSAKTKFNAKTGGNKPTRDFPARRRVKHCPGNASGV